MAAGQGPLAGIRIIEMAGIGPAPMCGMMLADLGAEILRIDRPSVSDLGIERPVETNFVLRGRPTIRLDAKTPEGQDLIRRLIAGADGLIEGFRPGVMERLGLGPETCHAINPALVFGRVTGWGQNGPLAKWAGHDLNYLALTGALEAMGRKGELPPVPLNLIGDFGGGAMFLAIGMLSALLSTRETGRGQVVDAAIVDGVSTMLNSFIGLRAGGVFSAERGSNILDSGAFFYNTYACGDGGFIAVGAIEKRFYAEFLSRLGLSREDLPPQEDRSRWEEGRKILAAAFLRRSRDEWAAIFAESDACVTPVLTLEEAFRDPHMMARGSHVTVDGHVQAAPGPRFSATPPAFPRRPEPPAGAEALRGWLPEADLLRLAGALE